MNVLQRLRVALCLAVAVFVSCNKSSAPSENAGTPSDTAGPRIEQGSAAKYSAAQLSKVTGLVVPKNLPEIALRANRLSAKVVATVKATSKDPIVKAAIDHPDFCNPSAPSFDFRQLDMVSPVKDQGECGACWAFATNAVLESSYLALRKEHISASEQELVSCNSSQYSCAGGWWAFDFLNKPGVESEKSYPYEHADTECRSPLRIEFRVLQSGYVAPQGQENSVPSTQDLKNAMCKHGVLAVGFNATPSFIDFGYQHRNQHQVFAQNDTGEVNHGIVLVGWDDSKQAWIIKNSWNTTWGDDGFLFVKYGTNSIGLGAAWAVAWPKDYVPALRVRNLLKGSLKTTTKTANIPE